MIVREKVTSAGGIPLYALQISQLRSCLTPSSRSMAMELVEAFAAKAGSAASVLESVGFGGGPASRELASSIIKAIPTSQPNQGYGATECSSAAATVSGEDFLLRASPPSTVDQRGL